jgi:uridine kinase
LGLQAEQEAEKLPWFIRLNELPDTEVGIIHRILIIKRTTIYLLTNALLNFDHPRAIDFALLVAHLKELREQKTIQQPVYSFVTHNRTEDTITTHPRKVMIVEGILILANPELRDLFDVKIYVHDERLTIDSV